MATATQLSIKCAARKADIAGHRRPRPSPLAQGFETNTLFTVATLTSIEAIRRQVHKTLCERDRLDPAHAPLFQSVIKRKNRPCGLFFHIQGPRALRNYAVWAGEEDRILFYDSKGERFAEIRLAEAPDPLKLAA